MDYFLKSPDAITDYAIDWGAGYLADGESILSSEWSIFPTGGDMALTSHGTPQFNDNMTTIFIKGGVAGFVYSLMNKITTSNGRTDERTIRVRIGER